MDRIMEEEIEQQRRAWKEQYAREYDRLTSNIGALENDRGGWAVKAFYELRNHLQVFDALNEKIFTLSATLRVTQKRLAVTEAELAKLERDRQPRANPLTRNEP